MREYIKKILGSGNPSFSHSNNNTVLIVSNDEIKDRDNLPTIKDGPYVINLDEYSDIRTHWVALWLDNNDVTYFDSFGVEHITQKIKTFINSKNIKNNYFQNTSI